MHIFSVPTGDDACMLVVFQEDVDDEYAIELHCREASVAPTCPIVTLAGCDLIDVTETMTYWE